MCSTTTKSHLLCFDGVTISSFRLIAQNVTAVWTRVSHDPFSCLWHVLKCRAGRYTCRPGRNRLSSRRSDNVWWQHLSSQCFSQHPRTRCTRLHRAGKSMTIYNKVSFRKILVPMGTEITRRTCLSPVIAVAPLRSRVAS